MFEFPHLDLVLEGAVAAHHALELGRPLGRHFDEEVVHLAHDPVHLLAARVPAHPPAATLAAFRILIMMELDFLTAWSGISVQGPYLNDVYTERG